MSTPRFLVTGATGYIGGDALDTIINAHPDWQVTCLVRNSDKGALVAARYPAVRLVYGDLGSTKMIEEEAKQADVVLDFADADNIPCANAIAAGLLAGTNPTYWIHTSGTGILTYPDVDASSYGASSNKVWDDVADIDAIRSIPDHAPHRDVDKVVLAAAGADVDNTTTTLRTAIVCPPTIYGTGRGVGNTYSMQLPWLAQHFLNRGAGFQVAEGQARWSNVHIHDLSNLYLRLAEAAVQSLQSPEAEKRNQGLWGAKGYYFAENGEHVWGETSAGLAKKAQSVKLLDNADVASLPAEDVEGFQKGAKRLWGANSRSRASRAREALGWTPGAPALEETFEEVLQIEAKRTGVKKGHAVEAAGDA